MAHLPGIFPDAVWYAPVGRLLLDGLEHSVSQKPGKFGSTSDSSCARVFSWDSQHMELYTDSHNNSQSVNMQQREPHIPPLPFPVIRIERPHRVL